jgi:hypothetical protein
MQEHARPNSGPVVYTGDGTPLDGGLPLDWAAMLEAAPVCVILQNGEAAQVDRIMVLPVAGAEIPGDMRRELTAAISAGGAVAIHGPSHTAAAQAARAIRTAPPRWHA